MENDLATRIIAAFIQGAANAVDALVEVAMANPWQSLGVVTLIVAAVVLPAAPRRRRRRPRH